MLPIQDSKSKLNETINKETTKSSNKSEIQNLSSELESSSASEKKNASLHRKSRKRKRKRSNLPDDNKNDEEESYIDNALEEKLQECAKRNNLSPIEIKKILKSLVGNDHVLAMVKIQEEEEIAKEKCEKKEHEPNELHTSSSKNLCKGENLVDPYIPKLTRAKARALNKKPMPIPPLNEKQPEPEVAALISQELNSDEEDEEYCPKDEDFMSDDDQNTTISDVDSQPATPLTPQQYSQDSHDSPSKTPVRFTEDGIFKLPQKRSISTGSNSSCHHEEIIAKRTRSKLCLQTTPIEAIESTFIPPDITNDMYDFDGEMDQEWVAFLNEFTKPLNVTNSTEEDEDDPEYVAAEKVPIDAEELRDVNISKKELSDLITELFDGLTNDGVFVEDLSTPDASKNTENEDKTLDKSPQRKKLKLSDDIEKLPLSSSPKKSLNDKQEERQQTNLDLSTVDTFDRAFNNENNNTTISTQQNHSYFNPNIISTPQSYSVINRQYQSLTNYNPQSDFQSTITNVANVANNNQTSLMSFGQIPTASVGTIPTNFIGNLPTRQNEILNNSVIGKSNVTTYVTLPIAIPVNGSVKQNLKYIAIPINLASNLQIPSSNCRIVNTIDLTKSPSPPPSSEYNNTDDIAAQSTTINSKSNLPQTSVNDRKTRKKRKRKEKMRIFNDVKESYAKKYEQLKTIEIEEEIFDENQIGFTEYQRKILQQQIQMHVQFCTQNFIQTYSHPELWKLAQPEKNMLLELEKKCEKNTKSAFNAWNLKPALELIESWENELSECSEENRALMDFFYSEIDRIKRAKGTKINVMRFPPRIMKLIVQSSVFMYPHLLPKIPFRFNINNLHQEFCPSEDHIIAHAMDYYFKELKEKKPSKTRCSELRMVVDKIAKNLITWKSWKTIYNYIIFCRDKKACYNPIKFYFERGRAPPFKHILHEIDLECVLPPQYRISELPSVWKEFVTILTTVELKKTCPQRHRNNKKITNKSSNNDTTNNNNNTSTNFIQKDIILSETSLKSTTENQNPTINTAKNQTSAFGCIVNKSSNDISNDDGTSNSRDKNFVVNFNYIFDNNIVKDTGKINNILNTTKSNSLTTTNIHYIQTEQDQKQQQDQNSIESDSVKDLSLLPIIHTDNNVPVINTENNTTNGFSQIFTTIHNRVEPENDQISNYIKNSSTSNQIESYCEENILNKDEIITIPSPIPQSLFIDKGQKLLTDYFEVKYSKKTLNSEGNENIHNNNDTDSQISNKENINKNQYSINNINEINSSEQSSLHDKYYRTHKISLITYDRRIGGKRKKHLFLVKKYLNKIKLRKKFVILINTYKKYINSIYKKYKNKYLQEIYTYFKTLELYTNLLDELKMNCKKLKTFPNNLINNNTNEDINNYNSSISSNNTCINSTNNSKRPKLNDDELKQQKKSTKANENLKLMLMIENNEDINKKNAIYASNFYEKVEEVFKEKNQMENFKKFQNILKKFNPNKDRVTDLYNKIENLFLPDHPDLVEVFLTFLLPSQAAEIGKFFEYFMLTNMTNFINKLNIYFSKQPSQIKKVYASLNELSEENNLTMEKIKSKILPLLKGNQFLIDWFLQMFPSEEPPTSLDAISENISAKQLETQISDYTPEFVSQKDLIPDSPDHQPCQIRYINGRVFYGSRILLPAKLAFIAKNSKKNEEWNIGTGSGFNTDYEDDVNDENEDDNGISSDDERLTGTLTNVCVHPISTYAEKILKNQNQCERDSCTEGEKSEDEDIRDNEIKYKICDDAMHKQHALRLNPSLYLSANYTMQSKLKCDINDREISKSPKKQCIRLSNSITTSPSSTGSSIQLTIPTPMEGESGVIGGIISSNFASKDKRKSPIKKTFVKSPVSTKKYIPSVICPSTSTNSSTLTEITTTASGTTITPGIANAVKTAKKLKAMIEENNSSDNQIKQQKKKFIIKKSTSIQSSSAIQKPITGTDISVSETECNSRQNINWTRDEDKIILEEVKLGFDSEENLMNRLKLKLSNRTVSEITHRHQFLMDVLSQLQNRT